ncbi:hypothetical protein FEM48_Zijuj01G0302900 [Ziziphus jujuba var. spinosa]|uniref:F-box domain-containing protein n=1 Tax=Ziziphus jujuba var. spinosa TaxID=714518 RepID=A0A978W5Z0_ZIZJJ|nr:hypothetical protein FEM48_Zijuj01G0302900 [Ziziphus jujuba var. spinosa]
MWKDLPFDVLSTIFSFLSPDSLARARSACRQWHTCARAYPLASESNHPSWFIALPLRNLTQSNCFLLNPVLTNWHSLSLDFLPIPVRPVGSVGGFLLLRTTNSTTLRLILCNPFTRQYKHLPLLSIPRSNPAVGVVPLHSTSFPSFRVYVAGGMSEAPYGGGGGATYEPTLEMYDSNHDTWKVVGNLPMEYAVRMTVWTPNECVYSDDDGLLYWITSARAYSLMGYEVGSKTWRELRVPMADKLEFAALVWRKGRLTLVGGTCGADARVWELSEGDNWVMVEKVPVEMGMKFAGEKGSWAGTKCVGSESNGAIYLYKDVGSGMLVWKENGEKGNWDWFWIDGCGGGGGGGGVIRGKQVSNLQIKGLLIQPNLALSSFF